MIGWFMAGNRMASLVGKWADATSLNPGDNGQIALFARELMRRTGLRAEDAWIRSLIKWIRNHPDSESRVVLATALIRFLDIYEHSAGLSPETKGAARQAANDVLRIREAQPQATYTLAPPAHRTAPAKTFDPLALSRQVGSVITDDTTKWEVFTAALDYIKEVYGHECSKKADVENNFAHITQTASLSVLGCYAVVGRLVVFYFFDELRKVVQQGKFKGFNMTWTVKLLDQTRDWSAANNEQDWVDARCVAVDRALSENIQYFHRHIN